MEVKLVKLLNITLLLAGLAIATIASSSPSQAALEDYPDWAQEAFCPRTGGQCY